MWYFFLFNLTPSLCEQAYNFLLFVSAHEITHAFDEVGIMYNSKGLFQPLYDNETIEAFGNASDCIRQQYSNFR